MLTTEDPVEEIPQDTVMASRVSVLLRGMGNAFGIELRTAPVWRPYAEALLKEQAAHGGDAGPPVKVPDEALVEEHKAAHVKEKAAHAEDVRAQRGKLAWLQEMLLRGGRQVPGHKPLTSAQSFSVGTRRATAAQRIRAGGEQVHLECEYNY